MRPWTSPRPPDRGAAHPLLVDWLETGPVGPGELRSVLVLGDPTGAEVVARRVPGASVDSDRHVLSRGQRYDLVAAVGWSWSGGDPAELAAAVAVEGTLLVIESVEGDPTRVEAVSSELSGLAAAGLHLTAFDDLSEDSAEVTGRRWLRATFRRGSR